jgi:predicted enzyme related to lactoylglutathione lyase
MRILLFLGLGMLVTSLTPLPMSVLSTFDSSRRMSKPEFRGIYTTIYRAPDLAQAKAWYSRAFGVEPYFDEPFYVGFNISGYELGLQAEEGENRAGRGGVVAYWGVENADQAVAHLLQVGAILHGDVQDVGGGIRVGTVSDPFGNVLGIIENPDFRPQGSSGDGAHH